MEDSLFLGHTDRCTNELDGNLGFDLDVEAHLDEVEVVDLSANRVAVDLASNGENRLAVDIDLSPTALASARERAGGLGIHWIEADLDRYELGAERYAVVVCVGFTREALMPGLARALQPGGLLVYAARPRAQRRFGPRPGDVARWFAELRTLAHRDDGERIRYAGVRGSSSG